jgi:hypothetical protein
MTPGELNSPLPEADDHDQRFKNLFQLFLDQLIRLFFPEIAEKLDFTTVEWLQQETFLDAPTGEKKFADLVAKVRTLVPPVNGSPDCLILLHLEVEWQQSISRLHPRMDLYSHSLESRHGIPVLPIVFFLRLGLDGIGILNHEVRIFEFPHRTFSYLYVGLPGLDAMRYIEREEILGVALAGLMKLPEKNRVELIIEMRKRIGAKSNSERDEYFLSECLENYFPLKPDEAEQYQQRIQLPEVENMWTVFERRGFVKGKQEGQSEGKLEGKLEDLQLYLQKKFGPLSESVRNKLASLNLEEATRTFEQSWDAKTLEDLGL